jgi:hypothetical protein
MYLPDAASVTRELMGVDSVALRMSQWQGRVNDLLYDGESVLETVDVGTAQVVVTSHRVLAFTPEMDGRNFQQADRPNAVSVKTSALAKGDLLERGIRYLVIGGVLIAAGTLFDFGSIMGDTDLSTGESTQLGLGGIMEITQQLLNLMQNLDQLLQTFGALALLLAVVLLGVYWFLRDPTLVIEMAGDEEDVHIPRSENVDQIRARLEQVILPDADVDAAATAAGSTGPPDDPLGEGAVGGGQAVTDATVTSDGSVGSETSVSDDAVDGGTWGSQSADEGERTQPADEEGTDSGWRDDI